MRGAAEKHAARGQLDRAVDLYHRVLGLRDDDHLAWRGLALVEERLGHRANARAAWSRVLALDPETPEARREAEDRVRGQ